MESSTLLTAADVADRIQTTERFVRRLVAERRIRYVKCGKFVRIPEPAIDEYLLAHTVEPVGAA